MRVIIILICLSTYYHSGSAQSQWNHLRHETSHYLLQHAHNPTDWYPWKKVALDKANNENKLLIISIGYASCHWCHVMESETFSDTSVSVIMNTSYVSIKVDREERPDIDQLYLSACQLIHQESCGWPLNVIALPDGRPIYIGTYMKQSEWKELIRHFAEQYRDQPGKMKDYANDLSNGIKSNSIQSNQYLTLTDSLLHDQAKSMLSQVDFRSGGKNGAPKFPTPAMFDFLLAYGKIYHEPIALQAVYTLLDHLMTGGIHDLLEGGFSRYSIDEEWKVPHFEKMLYDNVQLISLYAHAYQLSKNERYKTVIKTTIDFLNRNLLSPNGAYYSSLDADTHTEGDTKEDPSLREGKYYVWTKDEIAEALIEPALIESCNRWFNIIEEGNAFSDQQYHMLGKNVLSFHRTNNHLVYPQDYSDSIFTIIKSKLLTARLKRIRPARDEKIICAWNALTISGLVDAYTATGNESYKNQALMTGRFIWEHMRMKNELTRIYGKDKNQITAFLDDYAQTGMAYVKLYQITFDERWLKRAIKLKDIALKKYSIDSLSLFYYTSHDQPKLISRQIDIQDQEIPSSNATMARLLMILGDYYSNQQDRDRAEHMIQSLSTTMISSSSPLFYYSLENALLLSHPPYEIAIVGNQYHTLQSQLTTQYIPYALWCGGKNEGSLPLLKNKLQRGNTTIYVCKNNMCLLPVHTSSEALKLIN